MYDIIAGIYVGIDTNCVYIMYTCMMYTYLKVYCDNMVMCMI